jgi:hypothetical protein
MHQTVYDGTACATGCVTEFALFAVKGRQNVFRTSEKPAEIAGFCVKSLVALPGIVSRLTRISHY